MLYHPNAPSPDGQNVAESSLDVILLEKHSLQSSPWGGAKPLVAHGLLMNKLLYKYLVSWSKLIPVVAEAVPVEHLACR